MLAPKRAVLLALATALVTPACLYVTPNSDGPTLFRVENCANCHGPNGAGSPNGPPLLDLERNWTPETLTDFLVDPDAWLARTPRLAAISREHRNRMPSYRHLSGRERRGLAAFVLLPRPYAQEPTPATP